MFFVFFWTKSNMKVSLQWMLIRRDKMSMVSITQTSINSFPNFIQIDIKLCEITGTKMLAFLHPCDPESRSRSFWQEPKYRLNSIYHHMKSGPNWFVNIWTHANQTFFLTVSTMAVTNPLMHWISLNISIRILNINCFNTMSHFIRMCWKVCKKKKPPCFALRWPCDPWCPNV